jgi:hypothetical protein
MNRELHLEILVPIRVDPQFSFPDPFGITLNDRNDLKFMRDIEFLQSSTDREEFVASFRVEPILAAQIVDGLSFDSHNMFPRIPILHKHAIVFCCPSFGAVGPISIDEMQNFP